MRQEESRGEKKRKEKRREERRGEERGGEERRKSLRSNRTPYFLLDLDNTAVETEESRSCCPREATICPLNIRNPEFTINAVVILPVSDVDKASENKIRRPLPARRVRILV